MKKLLILLLSGCFILFNLSCKDEPCDSITCLNDGSCNDGKCTCEQPFEGEFCEKLEREKFIATYQGRLDCPSGLFDVSVGLSSSSSSNSRVVINFPANVFSPQPTPVVAEIAKRKISILTNHVSNQVTFNGQGEINESATVIEMSISFKFPDFDAENCSLKMTKL